MCLDECPPADTPPEYLRVAVRADHPLGRALPGRPPPARPGAVRHRPGRDRPRPAGRVCRGAGRRSTSPATPWAASASARRRSRWSRPWRRRAALLPADKPRYLMGVGRPRGPPRRRRRAASTCSTACCRRATAAMPRPSPTTGPLRLRNACHKRDPAPLESGCPCYTCRHFSRAYLHHLFLAEEMLGPTLLSLHNVAFYCRLMAEARRGDRAGAVRRVPRRSALPAGASRFKMSAFVTDSCRDRSRKADRHVRRRC